jgi:DNA-binding NtrC family response regulator
METKPLREIIRRKKMEVERTILIQALRKTRGNKAEAARLLKISYSTIHSKLKYYGIY